MSKKEELEAQGFKTYENEDIRVFWNPKLCQHTGVREAYEGKGIARKLVLKVVEAARAKGVRILPVCSYAKKLMTSQEEFKDLM